MTCFSTDGQICEGTLTLRRGSGAGTRAGRARFTIRAAAGLTRIYVGLNRRTRARLRRHSLLILTGSVANTKPGGVAGRRTVEQVLVRGGRPKRSR